jgi:ribosomal protein L36
MVFAHSSKPRPNNDRFFYALYQSYRDSDNYFWIDLPGREREPEFPTKLAEKFVHYTSATNVLKRNIFLAKIVRLLIEHRETLRHDDFYSDVNASYEAFIPVSTYMRSFRDAFEKQHDTFIQLSKMFVRIAANHYYLYQEGMRNVREFADKYKIEHIRGGCLFVVCVNDMKHPEESERFEQSCKTIQCFAEKKLLNKDDNIEEEVISATNKIISKVCLSALTNVEDPVDYPSLLVHLINIIRVLCSNNPKFRDNLGIKVGLFVESIQRAKRESIVLQCFKVLEVLSTLDAISKCMVSKNMVRLLGEILNDYDQSREVRKAATNLKTKFSGYLILLNQSDPQ